MKFQMKQGIHRFRNQTGFTMLEVVIAMALGGVGVMAFIGLQLKAVEISEESRQRSNAAYIAEEMAERMMSNSQDYAAQRLYRGEVGSQWDDAPWDQGFLWSRNLCPGNFDSPGCADAATLAALDITEVKHLARAMLPNGDLKHKKCGPNDAFDCLVVTWESADVNACMAGTSLEDCYTLQLKIW